MHNKKSLCFSDIKTLSFFSTMKKWEIPNCTPHKGGFLLGKQIFCVQNGFACSDFIEASGRLIAKCFHEPPEQDIAELSPAGLSWDFIVAVFRGDNVCDVVSVCALVHGLAGDRQCVYVFDVCTDPRMVRRGIAKVLMSAVYNLCCAAVRVYWSGELWLVLDVDLKTKLVPPDTLIRFYTECKFIEDRVSLAIKPAENMKRTYSWAVTADPAAKRQMWRAVGVEDTLCCLPDGVFDCSGESRLAQLIARVERFMA